MNAEEFRKVGKEMIDYVADYLENIEKRPVVSSVEPGYLHRLIPEEAPQDPEKWEDVFNDIERVIMPGLTHWQHPHFHAYFPITHSYPSILAEILSAGIACNGFSWVTSPAYTELEVTMMDWLAKALKLPQEFLSGGKGGGVIQATASESTLIALLAARGKIFKTMKDKDSSTDTGSVLNKLVAYTSDQANSSVNKACLLAAVICHQVTSDENECMRGDTLAAAIEEDKSKGLVPFCVVATLGTTSTCAFDNLIMIGPVCQEAGVWLHIDAAYSGSSFICPEFRPLLDGVEYATSFNFNPCKWMLTSMDCSALWFRDKSHFVDTYNNEPEYLKYDAAGETTDYRNWQIHLSRRFRSLKLWFVLRLHGIKGIQDFIMKHVRFAKEFESYVRKDDRFEVTHPVVHGLVCFRLKKSNIVNELLSRRINEDARIFLVSSISKGRFFLRFVVCAVQIKSSHIKFAWDVISEIATKVLSEDHSN